ncbi:hypothetical protein [Variovorax boronicumulans]|uniref:hypothetical protein n=1 Tax=Variovorax boronicumulans TaxID=436515 RepID=UPI003391C414
MNHHFSLATLEGHEVSLSSEDHTKLTGWPLIDLSRLHVVGDEVHAEVDGKPHPLSLEGMLALMGNPTLHPPPETSLGVPACLVTPPALCRTCRVCKREKSATSFKRHNGSPDGLMSSCKTCSTKARRARKEFREAAEALASKGQSMAKMGGRLDLFRLTGQTSWPCRDKSQHSNTEVPSV